MKRSKDAQEQAFYGRLLSNYGLSAAAATHLHETLLAEQGWHNCSNTCAHNLTLLSLTRHLLAHVQACYIAISQSCNLLNSY